MTVAKPASRPNVPHFSSGPCAKRPGWNPQNLKDAALGRSHRAKVGKAKLKLAIELTREVLEVPADYKIGIVPASDTGAVEMALWSLLGARPVTTIAWESFGEGWVSDIVKELKEKQIEQLLDEPIDRRLAQSASLGRARRIDGVDDRYIEFAKRTLPRELSLDGLRVVVDCAHGAAYKVVPEALWELGADVIGDRRRTRRFQHQQGMRLDLAGGAGEKGARDARRHRHRARRRR